MSTSCLKPASLLINYTSKNRQQYLTWNLITRNIGYLHRWPLTIRKLFWCKELSFSECIRLASFAFINGLDTHLLELWFIICDTQKLSANETIRWLETFILSSAQYTYITYDVRRDCTLRVNGSVLNPFGHTIDYHTLDMITYD